MFASDCDSNIFSAVSFRSDAVGMYGKGWCVRIRHIGGLAQRMVVLFDSNQFSATNEFLTFSWQARKNPFNIASLSFDRKIAWVFIKCLKRDRLFIRYAIVIWLFIGRKTRSVGSWLDWVVSWNSHLLRDRACALVVATGSIVIRQDRILLWIFCLYVISFFPGIVNACQDHLFRSFMDMFSSC